MEAIQGVGFCSCGCGERTSLMTHANTVRGYKAGDYRRYVFGHHKRKNPGVRHLEEDRGYKTPCWIWQGSTGDDGYGRSHGIKAHRDYYIRLKCAIPEGLHLDHLCRQRACVNPDHLEPVTMTENNRRSRSTRLTQAQVLEIRVAIAIGMANVKIAAKYGCSRSHISNIRGNRCWADVQAGRQ